MGCDRETAWDIGTVSHQRMSPPVSVVTTPSNIRRTVAALCKSSTRTLISPLGGIISDGAIQAGRIETAFIHIVVVAIESSGKATPIA
jgi:hypothetical protein